MININKLSNFVVRLTVQQMIFLGIHIGHHKKNSIFLSSWLFYGWRNNFFIINLIKTFLVSRLALNVIKKLIRYIRPFWFVTMSQNQGPLIGRYASICGEPFNVFWWISGSLTNLKMVLDWSLLLFNFVKKDNFLFRHQDRKKLMYLFGFKFQTKKLSKTGFDSMQKRLFYCKKWELVSKRRKKVSYTFILKERNDFFKNKKFGSLSSKDFNFRNKKMIQHWVDFKSMKTFWRIPGAGFVPTLLDNLHIVDEFAASDLPFITLVDSNIISQDIMFPIVSNDDSIQCIIFFTYLFVKNIFISKLFFMKHWQEGLIKRNKLKCLNLKYLFLRNLKFIEKDFPENEINNILDGIFSEKFFKKKHRFFNIVKYSMFVPHETIFSFDTKYTFSSFINLKLKFYRL